MKKMNGNPLPERAIDTSDSGFTLLEMLVVVAILGLLIGLVAPAVMRQFSGARVSVAQQSIARLSSILDIYKLDVGSYPTSDQGLGALISHPSVVTNWNGPYLKGDAVPSDAWGHQYTYRIPSSRPGLEYDLCSGGPSNVSSGDMKDMICNRP